MEGDSQHFFSAFSLRVLTFCSVLPSLPLLCSINHIRTCSGVGGGDITYSGQYGEGLPKRGAFFKLAVY